MRICTAEQLPGCWVAVDDDTYGGPGWPIGFGFTEEAAIADLKEQLEERTA